VNDLWIVVMRPPTPTGSQYTMYLNEDKGWYSDFVQATTYKSKDEAEKAAFSTVTAEPTFIGCVSVVKRGP